MDLFRARKVSISRNFFGHMTLACVLHCGMATDAAPSKNQMNKLGKRLRHGELPTDEDLDLLAEYQSSLYPIVKETLLLVGAAYAAAFPEQVFDPTIREKQIRSIVKKLRREAMNLSSMQDLIGFRVVVPRATDQQLLIDHLPGGDAWRVKDRRLEPSHGYRAVHVIRKTSIGFVELRIRTQLQHEWAELSERLERRFPGVKYGRDVGDANVDLMRLSRSIAMVEWIEMQSHPAVAGEVRRLHHHLLATIKDLRDRARWGAHQ
jgi:Region found in RelA / SpoT proteins